MAIDISNLKKYANILGTGLIARMAPGVAKGMVVEFMKSKGVNVKGASEWVQDNKSLWNMLKPEEQEMMRNLAEKVGNIDWLTPEWVIESIKGDLPSIASLFLGWKKANNWLRRQVETIRKEIGK